MKKIISFILSLCLCLGLFGCDNGSANSISSLQVATEHIANGQYEEAYSLLYSIENRSDEEEYLFACFSFVPTMTEIRYSNGKTTVETYDEKGYCTEAMTTYSNGSWEKSTYTRDAAGNQLSLNKITSSGGWQTITCVYDTNGNRIAMYYESDWESKQTYIYTYDQNGNQLSKVWKPYNGLTVTTYYTYDAYNNVIEKKVYQNSVFDYTREYKYTYDTDGKKLSVVSSGESTKYTYDEQGRLTAETEYEYGAQSSQTVYTYDEYGNMTQKIATEPGGEQDVTVFTYQLIYRQQQ